jgi:hypothetical protein
VIAEVKSGRCKEAAQRCKERLNKEPAHPFFQFLLYLATAGMSKDTKTVDVCSETAKAIHWKVLQYYALFIEDDGFATLYYDMELEDDNRNASVTRIQELASQCPCYSYGIVDIRDYIYYCKVCNCRLGPTYSVCGECVAQWTMPHMATLRFPA